METLLYHGARLLIAFIQSLPLTWVARLGRCCGGLAYWLDARHRRVAVKNLTLCFGKELPPAKIRSLAKENFRRIGENFGCAIKTASMSWEELKPRLQFVIPETFGSPVGGTPPRGVVVAIGHFGNFELYARMGDASPAYKTATTYRGLRQNSLNRLLSVLRSSSGCRYFERRFDGAALRAFMNEPGIMLGLLADQHGGDSGLRIPFFGHDCSTSPAPAIFALRYNCALYTGICYRVGLARWRIEAGAEILTHRDGQPRGTAEITLDMNRALEQAVRKDPANWFWVHNRWKAKRYRGEPITALKPSPAAAPEPRTPSAPNTGGQ
jgi:lauroyl/myristoyl acyltransferase